VDAWLGRDPIARLEAYLRTTGALDDDAVEAVHAEAEAGAADLRTRMNTEPAVDPLSLFDHVYAQPTPQLLEQREQVRAELAAAAGEEAGA
jgi:pyruvate dehydrogenase E1 component alpha subunit